MRKLMFLLILIFSIGVVGCGGQQSESAEKTQEPANEETVEEKVEEVTVKNAEGLLNAFIESGMPVIDAVTYTSATDPNEKLGRPGEYIEKINFNDANFHEEGEEPGLSIEVFSEVKHMEKRRDYIQEITDTVNISDLQYYIYDDGLILFRIPYKVTPEVAAEYEKIFREYMQS